VVLRPRFEPREAVRARSERLAQLESAKDDPATLVSWHAASALYPGHRWSPPRNTGASTLRRRPARDLHRRFRSQ
jgi:hypothetical protein